MLFNILFVYLSILIIKNIYMEFTFSEYNWIKLNSDIGKKLFNEVKSKTDWEEDLIKNNIELFSDFHYDEARNENKNSRTYKSMTINNMVDEIIS
tara:strand:- start:968 stop:1252 length:285 start_codon:yes stop_codon:yes gene_type:complete